MKIKGLIFEDLVNYKKISMTIMFPFCTWKCGMELCQNSPLSQEPIIEIDISKIINDYINNPITEAIVMQGLEPFDSFNDIIDFIIEFREKSNDDIVIYTGYNRDEISNKIEKLLPYKNIIIKFGRYIPNEEKHFDEILGVYLASSNQYAERVC